MDDTCRLSRVTEAYLRKYEAILNHMIHGMTGASLTNSVSYNFMVQMIPHHRAAIEMSRNLLCYTTNLPLQDIADQIITEQTESIAQMEQIIGRCRRMCNSQRDVRMREQKTAGIMQRMFDQMRGACVTNSVDENFMREMIPHHRGAIAMSETTLRYPICDGLRPILEAIITSQKEGVRKMEELLARDTEKRC